MTPFKPSDFLVARWLAIAGAAGAAVAQAFGYFTANSYWNTVAFVAALLALAAVFGLWKAVNFRTGQLAEAANESDEQQRVLSALQTELEVHRNLERQLVEAKQTAESAVMAKGEFLATMSHEIRTPLNGIIPMLDLLMTSKLAPDQHDFLRTAYTSSRQMLRIVDDILDYSKLEANKLQLETTSFNLRELLDSIIRLLEKPAETKGLRLKLLLDPGVRLALRGDPVRLRQVVTNLISNALKFTERGSITLAVSRKGETRTEHELRFEVRDTGIGISKENIGNLFRAFAQADASTTRLYGGTGLGLVICQRIVDLMGGQIGVESEPGRGTTFWFEIPLLKAAGDVQAQRADLNGGRVLMLSSDPTLRQRMLQAAPSWGAQMADSDSTQDALARLRAAAARGGTWAFDLLIVDLGSVRSTAISLHRNLQRAAEFENLPVVYLKGQEPPPAELSDGNQVLILSRNMGSAEMRTAISTFIASPTPSQRAEPITLEAFDDMSMPASKPPPAAAETPAPKLNGRVLLVEDNPINQKVALSLIRMLGLECETADNGEIAIERMRAGDLDLVLMDCQMPVKDGYTATREWRQLETDYNAMPLPIIAMTANAMAGDRQKCLDAGMDDYLSKPVDRRLLEATLVLWLQRSPRGAPKPVVGGLPDIDHREVERAMGMHAASSIPGSTAPPVVAPQLISSTTNSIVSLQPEAPAAAVEMASPVANLAIASTAVGESRPVTATLRPTPPPPSRFSQPTPPPPSRIPQPTPPPPSRPAPVAAPANPTPAPPSRPAPLAAPVTPPPAAPPGPQLPVLDDEVIEELRSIMGAEYQGLIKLFLEDAPVHIQRLQAAAAAEDIAAMVAPAHTLKSSSANLGAMALSAVAKRIELGARTQSLAKPTLAVLMLENEFRRARAALATLSEA